MANETMIDETMGGIAAESSVSAEPASAQDAPLHIGIDVGSTTVKVVLLDEEDVNRAVRAIHAKFFDEY